MTVLPCDVIIIREKRKRTWTANVFFTLVNLQAD